MADGTSTGSGDERPDVRHLIDMLEEYLLGEGPSLTGRQLADDVGIDFETARQRWRSLGFSAVDEDVPAFTHADEDALRLTEQLSDLGLVDPTDEQALIRSLGRSFARLAEWQMGLLAKQIDLDEMSVDEVSEVMTKLVPSVESLQSYVWRRHTLAVASRLLMAAEREDSEEHEPADVDDGTQLVGVGFADIVNYTRTSRSLTRSELTDLVDGFEARALEITTAHGGRIVKTIGDEVLFVADEAPELAAIGLELIEERERHDEFPELRVGLAWGPTVARLGDVFGPVVNIASRLTSTSRPGRVLVDKQLAEELEDDERFRLRRVRRTSVKGYRKLEPWSLARAPGEEPDAAGDSRDPHA
jgi:adenylate cyclase